MILLARSLRGPPRRWHSSVSPTAMEARPEFVLLGGLVPALLCAQSDVRHAGTTDVDVQVDLEISAGSVNAARLEHALRDSDFLPDGNYIWRWKSHDGVQGATVKFELLADLDTQPAGATLRFNNCDELGAANLRGTGFAARDREIRALAADDDGVILSAEIYVAGLAGFLLAKAAAAYSRRKPKDWYDIAYVLLNNDYCGPQAAASRSWQIFGTAITSVESALTDLRANFAPGQIRREQAPTSARSHWITLTCTQPLPPPTRS
jgi:hypothetical protein